MLACPLTYAFHYRGVIDTNCGRSCLHSKKINTSAAPAGQKLGIQGSRQRHLARRLHAS